MDFKSDKLMLFLLLGAIFIGLVASLASCYVLFKIHDRLIENNNIIKLERYKE